MENFDWIKFYCYEYAFVFHLMFDFYAFSIAVLDFIEFV